MSKYEPLTIFLQAQRLDRLIMSFADVERELGFKLPPSAYVHPAWWANEQSSHVQARAWIRAGFETEQVDVGSKKLVFRRVTTSSAVRPSTPAGMAETGREFVGAAQNVARHPLIGWMKGTFSIEPGYDLAQSPFSQEELDEMEANLDRTADMVEQGMSKKR